MADNVTVTPGTGATVAADDIGGGVLVQRVKTTWGPDGTANDTDVATGKPMPVQLRASSGQTLSDTSGILISTTQLGTLGQVTKANSVPVVPATDWVYNTGYYVTAAVSSTTTLQSVTGAAGDYLDHVIVFPTTTAAGSVTVIDNATTVATYAGGVTTALLTLTPFTIFVGAVSRSGAWKLTLGSNVTALAVGRFS
jgi:hypothetical protein